jgi:methylglyoxal synthase
LIDTGTTAGYVESAGLNMTKVLPGPSGGNAQIAVEVACQKIKAVFFFVIR